MLGCGCLLPTLRTLEDLCLDFKGTVPSQEDFEEFDEEFWKSLEEVQHRIYGFQVFYVEFLSTVIPSGQPCRFSTSAVSGRLRCTTCSSAGFTASTFAVVCGGYMAWGS